MVLINYSDFTIYPLRILISIIASIWAGTKGNQWAWEEIEYKDEEDFHHAQKAWVKAGFIIGLICLFSGFSYNYFKNKIFRITKKILI